MGDTQDYDRVLTVLIIEKIYNILINYYFYFPNFLSRMLPTVTVNNTIDIILVGK